MRKIISGIAFIVAFMFIGCGGESDSAPTEVIDSTDKEVGDNSLLDGPPMLPSDA